MPSDLLDNINLNEVLCEHEVLELAKLHESLTKEAIHKEKKDKEGEVPSGGIPLSSAGLHVPFVEPS